MPTSPEAAATSLTLGVRGDSERARHALVDRLAAIDPNMGEVDVADHRQAERIFWDSVLADTGAGRWHFC
jgi:hypothetical protein